MDLVGSFKEKSASLAREMVDSYHLGDKPQRKDNVVLRFAVNYNCASESEIEAAHKKTSTELRALNAVLTTQIPSDFSQFFTIFMTIIDYKGFRILAHAAPTCKFQPLHDLNPKRLIINESIASQTSGLSCGLNLKSHTVQVNDDRRVRIPLAATVEVK
jgi:Clustered mitochondria